jgi:D-erythro-7,8-dihydroneopterin triphosphate epimerase
MATIRIENLKLSAVIGVNDWERKIRQAIVVNVALDYDAAAAAASDRIEDAVDYKALSLAITAICEQSQFCLIEALASAILTEVMRIAVVRRATVRVDKPGALKHTDSVSVEVASDRNP